MKRIVNYCLQQFRRQYITECDKDNEDFNHVSVYRNNTGHGYYTIDNAPTKYDLNFLLGDAFALKQKGLGPNHCMICMNDGTLNDVFVGPCSQCAQMYYGYTACDCQMKSDFTKRLLEKNFCYSEKCEIKRYSELAPIDNIGSFSMIDDCSERITISTSSTIQNDNDDESIETTIEGLPPLTIIHPDYCSNSPVETDTNQTIFAFPRYFKKC